MLRLKLQTRKKARRVPKQSVSATSKAAIKVRNEVLTTGTKQISEFQEKYGKKKVALKITRAQNLQGAETKDIDKFADDSLLLIKSLRQARDLDDFDEGLNMADIIKQQERHVQRKATKVHLKMTRAENLQGAETKDIDKFADDSLSLLQQLDQARDVDDKGLNMDVIIRQHKENQRKQKQISEFQEKLTEKYGKNFMKLKFTRAENLQGQSDIDKFADDSLSLLQQLDEARDLDDFEDVGFSNDQWTIINNNLNKIRIRLEQIETPQFESMVDGVERLQGIDDVIF